MFPGIWRSGLPATEPMRTTGGNESINIDFQVQMTSLFKQASAISRRDEPEFCKFVGLSENRGRRECRALDAPAVSRAK